MAYDRLYAVTPFKQSLLFVTDAALLACDDHFNILNTMATVTSVNQAQFWFDIGNRVHLLKLIIECMTIIGIIRVTSGANDKSEEV